MTNTEFEEGGLVGGNGEEMDRDRDGYTEKYKWVESYIYKYIYMPTWKTNILPSFFLCIFSYHNTPQVFAQLFSKKKTACPIFF